MRIFRETKKRTLYFWTILLSLALLCTQGVKLHTHNLDHNYDQQHAHIPSEAAVKHSHLSIAHLSTDISHANHHDEVVSEIDVNPDGLLKTVSSNLPALALFAFILALFLPGSYQHRFNRRRDKDTKFPWQYHLSPPLRAPPH